MNENVDETMADALHEGEPLLLADRPTLVLSAKALPITDPKAGNLSERLLRHVKVVECRASSQSADERQQLGGKFYSNMMQHARKAVFYGTYFGVVLKVQFEGTTDREKEGICKQYGCSLSSARRYIRLVENLEWILAELQKQKLVVEEMSLTQLLELLPKQEGKGGRPKKAPVKTGTGGDSDGAEKVASEQGEDDADEGDAEPDEGANNDEADNDEGGSEPDAWVDDAEIEYTIVVTGKVAASPYEIHAVVASLESGEAAIVVPKPLNIVRAKETIGTFTITHIKES